MTKTKQTSNIPVFSDVKAASYVEAVAEMAIKEAKRLLRDAKLLITWKTSNCGNFDNAGEVTAAFEGVFALRTKAEFYVALRDIQTVAMQFSQNWYRMARCRRTMQICTEKGLRVTPEMVESTEVARTEQLYSCRPLLHLQLRCLMDLS